MLEGIFSRLNWLQAGVRVHWRTRRHDQAEGTITAPEGVMKVSHIRVTYHVKIPAGKRPEADRALAVVERGCPVAQTLKGCVALEYHSQITEE